MLPLLPALILLLLHGPAKIERMADGGALPAALAAMQRRMGCDQQTALSQVKTNQYALASLLSMRGDPQLRQALIQILTISDRGSRIEDLNSSECNPAARLLRLEDEFVNRGLCIADRASAIGTPSDGFANSIRSRAGPFSR